MGERTEGMESIHIYDTETYQQMNNTRYPARQRYCVINKNMLSVVVSREVLQEHVIHDHSKTLYVDVPTLLCVGRAIECVAPCRANIFGAMVVRTLCSVDKLKCIRT